MTEIDPLRDSRATRQMAGAGTAMTLWRWQHDPKVQFPPPDAVINNRNYWYDSTIRAWQRSVTARPDGKAVAPRTARGAEHAAA